MDGKKIWLGLRKKDPIEVGKQDSPTEIQRQVGEYFESMTWLPKKLYLNCFDYVNHEVITKSTIYI